MTGPEIIGFEAPEEIAVTFDEGVPVAIDRETVTVPEAVRWLDHRASAHGLTGDAVLRSAHRENGEARVVMHAGDVTPAPRRPGAPSRITA